MCDSVRCADTSRPRKCTSSSLACHPCVAALDDTACQTQAAPTPPGLRLIAHATPRERTKRLGGFALDARAIRSGDTTLSSGSIEGRESFPSTRSLRRTVDLRRHSGGVIGGVTSGWRVVSRLGGALWWCSESSLLLARRCCMTASTMHRASSLNAGSRSRLFRWLDRVTRHPTLYPCRQLLGFAAPVYLETEFCLEPWGLERASCAG
jgi:hypothetical protein